MTDGAGWSTSCPGCGAQHEGWMAECPKCGRREATAPPRRAATPPREPTTSVPTANAPVSRRTVERRYCPFCGKHAPPNAVRCTRCPPPVEASAGGACPRCKTAMRDVARDGVTVDVCDACGGAWLDRGEVEKILPLVTRGTGRPRGRLPRRTVADPVVYLPCVRCGESMARRQFAPSAGVIVDLCRAHGIWFDWGEIEHVGEFLAAGGLELARERDDDVRRGPRAIDASGGDSGSAPYGVAAVLGDFLSSLG